MKSTRSLVLKADTAGANFGAMRAGRGASVRVGVIRLTGNRWMMSGACEQCSRKELCRRIIPLSALAGTRRKHTRAFAGNVCRPKVNGKRLRRGMLGGNVKAATHGAMSSLQLDCAISTLVSG